jgi:hypothetical protein
MSRTTNDPLASAMVDAAIELLPGIQNRAMVLQALVAALDAAPAVRGHVFCVSHGAPRPVEHGSNQWAGAFEEPCGPHHAMMIGQEITEEDSDE